MAWIDPRPKPLQLWLDLDVSIDMIEIIPPPDAFSGCNPWNIQMIDDPDRREFIKGGAVALSAATMLQSESAAAQNASSNVVAPQPAVVFFNGDILTMEGDAAAYVEAVAIKDGKIAFAGSKKEALVAVDAASLIDLKGHTLLPGFIDAWGHFTLVAQETLGVNLAYFSEKPRLQPEKLRIS